MSSASAPTPHTPKPLQDLELLFAGLALAMANFIAVLDMTIANVSVTHIAGSLAISPSEGTYVITSYAVAEAITVPLTGWLAGRFGTLRVFICGVLMFGLFSALCGLATSLNMLVAARVFQGLSGGPIMPLAQTLLMLVFPKEKQAAALGLWAMTTLIAPIVGPILGGYICDHWAWQFIFYINIPFTLICSFIAFRILHPYETQQLKEKIDFVGLGLLVVWVASLQIMLDKGKELDWFQSPFICTMAVIALIGFLSFLIWELTEKKPVVDLRIFRHRGFAASALTISLAFGCFFSSIVLVPLWLQNYMGYTATWSGMTTAALGILAVMVAPFAAKFSQRIDPRILVFSGVMWLGIMLFIRSFATTDMTHWQIFLPMFFQGAGMPLFFVPLTALSLASVNKNEIASAAGMMSFLRTFSAAIATSIVTTSWDNDITSYRADLSERAMDPRELAVLMGESGPQGLQHATFTLNQLIQEQAVMLATNHIFMISACLFGVAAMAVWLAPKPNHAVDTSAAH